MSSTPPVKLAVPNFRTARLVGIFNVLFATEIIACGCLMSVYVATLPMMARVTRQAVTQVERQSEVQKENALKGLAEQESKATTEAEKADIAARREAINKAPKIAMMPMMDYGKMGFDDPTLIGWSWVEILTGVALNVALLASGIGLMHWRPWGRTLGLWTAALKIARIGILYTAFVILVVPPMSRNMGELASGMMIQQGATVGRQGGPPKELFVRVYTVTSSITGVGFALSAVVYPAILLWLLTRPGVRSACSGRFQLPKEPKQP